MTTQLTLIDPAKPADWRLDEHTRQIGLRGIAEARAQLERAAAAGLRPADEAEATAA